MIRLRMCLAASLIALTASSCGDANTKGEASHLKSYTAADVQRAFHAVTGDELDVKKALDLTRHGGGVSEELTIRSTLNERYGELRFVVQVEPSPDPALSAVSVPKTKPDQRGIYWHYQPPDEFGSGGWSATKYLRNVKLVWFTDEQKADARWERLDRVLRQLARGTKGG